MGSCLRKLASSLFRVSFYLFFVSAGNEPSISDVLHHGLYSAFASQILMRDPFPLRAFHVVLTADTRFSGLSKMYKTPLSLTESPCLFLLALATTLGQFYSAPTPNNIQINDAVAPSLMTSLRPVFHVDTSPSARDFNQFAFFFF